MSQFVHLHNHSEFSALDGMTRVRELAETAKKLGQSAVALTDHGTMAGVPEFYKVCKEVGIQPILGQEFYITPDVTKKDKEDRGGSNFHVVMYAASEMGWRILVDLSSKANTAESYYYRPRIDHSMIEEYGDAVSEIIVTTSCLSGEVSRALEREGKLAALKILRKYQSMFPNLYLELQRHPRPSEIEEGKEDKEDEFHVLQDSLNRFLIKQSPRLGIPLLITNDSHYPNEEDERVHDLLLAMQTKSDYDDPSRFSFSGSGYHLKSNVEMKRLWKDKPNVWKDSQRSIRDIVSSTADVRIPEFETKVWHIPIVPGTERDPARVIRRRCVKRLRELGLNKKTEYTSRLDHELGVIREANFETVFLIVDEYVNFARDRGIVVGAGRGSMVGVLVSYLLGITEIDPIRYKLLFERAINPARPSIPDFDIDFENDRIDEVIEHVKDIFGAHNVMPIGTQLRMAPRGVTKEVLRTFRVPPRTANKITEGMPETAAITNHKATGDMEVFLKDYSMPELDKVFEEHPFAKTAIIRLQGLLKSYGQHAAGIIITDDRRPLLGEVPQSYVPSSGKISSQFDMDGLKTLHFVKFDFLGLSTLKMISQAKELIGFDPFEGMGQNFEDKKTFEMMSRGELATVFQLQGMAARQVIQEMGINDFEDIVATNALARPGSINFLGAYAAGKHNREGSIILECSELESILGYTQNVILYQEQVMQIVKELAGWDDLGADRIKEAIKSKSGTEFDEMKPEFIDGCVDNGIKRSAARRIWKRIDSYRSYGFNRAHAVAYSAIGFHSAYLKCHFPVEWFTSVLNNTDKNFEDVIDEIRRLDIDLHLPDINRSSQGFSTKKSGIRFGIKHIKGIGDKSSAAIIEERENNGRFKSKKDFLKRTESVRAITSATVRALDESGAFSRFSSGQVPTREQELERLGTFVSQHPLDGWREGISELIDAKRANFDKDKAMVNWGGMINRISQITTKKGDQMAFVTVSYYGENHDIVFFPNTWSRWNKLKKNSIIVVSGQRDFNRNSIIANRVKVLEEVA